MKASVRLGTLGSLLTIAIVPAVKADALEDSHLSLGLRNFYVDRDFKQNNAPSHASAVGARASICNSGRAIPMARSSSVLMPPGSLPIGSMAVGAGARHRVALR